MAGPFGSPFVLPLKCAVSGDDIPWITPVPQIAKKIKELGDTDDAKVMMKQLYYLRGLVLQETARTEHFRCMFGSAPGDAVYIWFPLKLKHTQGLLTIGFFNRMIETFTHVLAGNLDQAAKVSRDVLR